nr:putative retrotransposon Ty1-copia subclass protein [Tanacetum cinerariifolium]
MFLEAPDTSNTHKATLAILSSPIGGLDVKVIQRHRYSHNMSHRLSSHANDSTRRRYVITHISSHKAAKGNQGKGKAKIGYALSLRHLLLLNPRILYHPRRIILRRPRSSTNAVKGSRKLKPRALSLYVNDGHRASVEAIREFHLYQMCLHVDAEEHELGDLGEPANYKAALLDPESDKWLNVMNVEMQSMKDNEVWDLVDLPPNGKTVSSKWLFKKKTYMDGAVHTYKARLVAKGFTQNYEVN